MRRGTLVQKVNRGSNVHTVWRVDKHQDPVRVETYCGNGWAKEQLVRADSSEAERRPCKRCLKELSYG